MISFKWAGTKEWIADFSRFQKDLSWSVWQTAARQIIQNFHAVEAELILSGGGKGDHGQWAALSEKYRKWKEAHFPGSPIMMLHGDLFYSLMGRGPDAIKSVVRLPGGGVTIQMGTAVTSKDGYDYPTGHQLGSAGHKASGSAKARRTIDPTNKQTKEWLQIIQRHVVASAMKYEHAFDKVQLNQGSWDREDRRAE